MVTLKKLHESLDGTTLEGTADLRGLDEPGHGSEGVAEIWFEGPVESSGPVIAEADLEVEDAGPLLLVEELAEQLTVLLRFFAEEERDWGISERATVVDNFSAGDPVYVGPHATIGEDVEVGKNVRIDPGVHVKGPAQIGDGVHLHSGVRVVSPVEIGARTVVHANTVIGADGYGYDQTGEGHEKIPQIGKVVIREDVEIGALAAIDRATYGRTIIGAGSKLDNHVQIGHNCRIGENCLMVAKSGLAGSVTLGDNVILAGLAAIEDHTTLADGVIVAAKAGVTKDIEEEGTVVSGFPAQSHSEQLKIQAVTRKLPQLREDVRVLKRKFDQEVNNSSGD